jgi:putative PEP-CTERM system histidine kinase
MNPLIGFWSHALAATAFAAVLIWRVIEPSRQPAQKLMLAGLAITACWAWLTGITEGSALARYAETARNLVWIGLLYTLSSSSDERQRGVGLVYGAVAAVLGLQLVVTTILVLIPSEAIIATSALLRMTVAAGALILVHNFYAQAAPATRSHVRFTMLGLAAMWVFDLHYHTLRYLELGGPGPQDWRGLLMTLAAPLFALGARDDCVWRVKLSRTASFQSFSLLAICAYFALMAILATALRGATINWASAGAVAVMAILTVGGMVILPSSRARGWIKVKLAKHLFEHRYDYRSEWLRFTATLGQSADESEALSERVVKAIADIFDSPGGMLLNADTSAMTVTAQWHWPTALPDAGALDGGQAFWNALAKGERILEFEAIRGGYAPAPDKALPVPAWLLDDPSAWVGVPLIHEDGMAGLVVLAAPDYRRPLDWEDFDILKTAGRQAASSLADARSREALATAQKFEEFNRRFAFILHDIKNLVSQLSLLARNAERHADKAEFRADMVATLKSSVAKMNDLLARLAPHGPPRINQVQAQPLRPILTEAIAAARGDREVQLAGHAGLWAQVDDAALERALRNLIHNALDASPLTEPVVVKVGSSGTQVSIAVIDKGCGMTSDFIANGLFLPFASTKSAGFGVGAFETRSIIGAMGGRLAVESRPGEGSIFTIFLPAAEEVRQAERKRA